jgi:hypothetical protein
VCFFLFHRGKLQIHFFLKKNTKTRATSETKPFPNTMTTLSPNELQRRVAALIPEPRPGALERMLMSYNWSVPPKDWSQMLHRCVDTKCRALMFENLADASFHVVAFQYAVTGAVGAYLFGVPSAGVVPKPRFAPGGALFGAAVGMGCVAVFRAMLLYEDDALQQQRWSRSYQSLHEGVESFHRRCYGVTDAALAKTCLEDKRVLKTAQRVLQRAEPMTFYRDYDAVRAQNRDWLERTTAAYGGVAFERKCQDEMD